MHHGMHVPGDAGEETGVALAHSETRESDCDRAPGRGSCFVGVTPRIFTRNSVTRSPLRGYSHTRLRLLRVGCEL